MQGDLRLMLLPQVFRSVGDLEGVFVFNVSGMPETRVGYGNRRIRWVTQGGRPLDPLPALLALADVARLGGAGGGSFRFEARPAKDLIDLGWPGERVAERILALVDERSYMEKLAEEDPMLLNREVRVRPEGVKGVKGEAQVAYLAMRPYLERGTTPKKVAATLGIDPKWAAALLFKLAELGVVEPWLGDARGEGAT